MSDVVNCFASPVYLYIPTVGLPDKNGEQNI